MSQVRFGGLPDCSAMAAMMVFSSRSAQKLSQIVEQACAVAAGRLHRSLAN